MSLDFHELRTVHSVVYDVYNIRKYGATGGADDSAAISRCIEDCRSKGEASYIFLPVSGPLRKSQCTLMSNSEELDGIILRLS